jgi:hypothetical protein
MVYLALFAVVPVDCTLDAAGERSCTSPAWVFAAVWVPYFVIEALVRAKRYADLPAAENVRKSSAA